MKFNVERTSDWEYNEQIEINSLEELIKFIDKHGSIVMTPCDMRRRLPTIEIYDTWRE